jgi:hypothetical protein
MDLQLSTAERAALSAEMKRIGSLGGRERARRLNSERLREIALKGVKARAAKLAASVRLVDLRKAAQNA